MECDLACDTHPAGWVLFSLATNLWGYSPIFDHLSGGHHEFFDPGKPHRAICDTNALAPRPYLSGWRSRPRLAS